MQTADAAFRLLQNVDDLMDVLKGCIESTIARQREPYATACRLAWGWVHSAYPKVRARIADQIALGGDPLALYRAAGAWPARYGAPAMELTWDVDASSLLTDDYWAGAAADQYRQTIATQQKALEMLNSTLAKPLNAALSGAGTALMVFWGAVVVAFAGLVVVLIQAIAAASTAEGAPLALVILGRGLLIFSAVVASAAVVLVGTLGSLTGDLESGTSGITRWPQPLVG